MHDQLNLSCPSPPGVEGADGLDRGHAARGRGDKGREGEGGKGEGGEATELITTRCACVYERVSASTCV